MKDITGREIKIGDKVVTCSTVRGRSLYVGIELREVIGFTAKMVKTKPTLGNSFWKRELKEHNHMPESIFIYEGVSNESSDK